MAPRFRDASELGRTATSASSLTLPLPVRYSSVQKICRVCSRGSVRQDAKLPMTRGREKVVASAIVFVDDVLNLPHRTPRPWKAFERVEGKMSTYRR